MTDEPEAGGSPERSTDRLSVRAQDEHDACLQLAARWAELYPPRGPDNDQTAGLLARFRSTHAFIDAVIHGLEPPSVPE